MNKEKGYNGYTNYETWLICLNLDNDRGLYEMFKGFKGTEKDLREAVEEITYIKEHNIYKISDTWTCRDWNKINWIEVLETRIEE